MFTYPGFPDTKMILTVLFFISFSFLNAHAQFIPMAQWTHKTCPGPSSVCNGTTDKNPGASCLQLKQNGVKTSGTYWIKVAGVTFPVYCDMTNDGGGWMLVLANTTTSYARMTDKNLSVVTPTSNGGHQQVIELMGVASESRWTDTSNNKLFWFKTNMAQLWTMITTYPCNQGDPTVLVTLEGGYLNTSMIPRKMEACLINSTSYYIGFRNNTNYAPIRDILDNTTTHECWHDSNALDRPFALHGSPIGQGFCNQFNYDYSGKGAGRGGTMNYLIWVR